MAQTTSQALAAALSGLSFRNNLNTILAALFSASSGPAAPSTAVVGQFWFDTVNQVMMQRNNANTAWVVATPETVAANTLWGNPTGSAAALQSVSMSQLRTMLGFSQTLATAQVQVLPGGGIMQAGTVATTATGVSVTFPVAFSTTPKLVLGEQDTIGAGMATYQNLTASGVTLQAWTDAGVQVVRGVSWLAMGY